MTEKQEEGAAGAAVTEQSYLDQMISAGIAPENDEAAQWGKDMIGAFVQQLVAGRTVSKRVDASIKAWVKEIDKLLSAQLSEVMHHADFRKLEGSWRGLHHLVRSSNLGTGLKIRVLNISKADLLKDIERAMSFDDSLLFEKIYTEEYGAPGGEPYGALIGDYEFGNTPDDMTLLKGVAGVAASAHAPFVAAAGPGMFGLKSFTELNKPKDIASKMDGVQHAAWKSFRASPDARYVGLTMPRVLSRLPYGEKTRKVETFNFEEEVSDHEDYVWMNASYAYATRLTDAFFQHGWCAATVGTENGGRVDGLPLHLVETPDGDVQAKVPTEVIIPDRRDAELSAAGFLSLSYYKNRDMAAFFDAASCYKPAVWDKPEANANEALSAQLNNMLCISRFAHYLKVMARDRIGSFMERSDCERWLNDWILNYVIERPEDAGPAAKAARPLREARIDVREVKGKPGVYEAVAFLRPHFMLKELNVSMSLVAELPPPAGG